MAYRRDNHLKHVKSVIALYHSLKKPHLPDTRIVRIEFPKHGIFISYSTWKNYKGMKKSEYDNQLSLFN